MKKITFLISVFIIALNTNAQNNLWPSEAPNTGANSTYLIQNVSFDNGELIYGKLGAFFTNDDGVLQNGGLVIWNNSTTSIAVWGDDVSSDSPEKDGFASQEEITWMATMDDGITTYLATVEYIEGQGSNNYITNGVNIISLLTISNTIYCVNDADGDGICDENESAGCTDSSAFNYNPEAQVDDGSCIEVVLGCTDENADNYNSLANTDNGTCSVAGCMNELAQNYNQLATTDDGSCIIDGCTDSLAFNYNPDATANDDSCLDAIDLNYDTIPTSNAINYNILANSISLNLGDTQISTEGDVVGAFQILNGELVCVGYNPWEEGDIAISLWLDDPVTVEVDGYVSNEPIYWMANQNSTGMNYLLEVSVNEFNIITDIDVNESVTLGCTDESAFNYTDGAIEDGSCEAIVEGCIDENACGYNASANTDDGSCYTLTVEISISDINTLTVNVESTNTEDVLTDPTYTWYLDGNETGGVINGTIIQAGEYALTVTDDLGCEQTSSSLQANLSVNEVIDNNIIIYPNPANSVINITSNNSDIHSFDLYNAIGELMLTKSELNSKTITINRNELKSGIYISKITDENGNSVVRNIIFE